MKSRFPILMRETRRARWSIRAIQSAILGAVIGLLGSAAANAAPFVYVTTSTQAFGVVDLATGNFQQIGDPTPDGLGNLVWWHGHTLLALVSSGPNAGSLASINPATGQETVIGPTGLGFNFLSLAEVRGKLYLTDLSNNIYSVDPDTGLATMIGATGMPADPNIPFTLNQDGTLNLCDEAFYGIAGKLYAVFDSFALDLTQTPPTRSEIFVAPALYQIDPATGMATFIANTDISLLAMFQVDGRVYAFRGVLDGFDFNYFFPIAHTELVTMDLSTGTTTYLRDIDHSVGLVFAATPVRGMP
jgi:hypothetical protein